MAYFRKLQSTTVKRFFSTFDFFRVVLICIEFCRKNIVGKCISELWSIGTILTTKGVYNALTKNFILCQITLNSENLCRWINSRLPCLGLWDFYFSLDFRFLRFWYKKIGISRVDTDVLIEVAYSCNFLAVSDSSTCPDIGTSWCHAGIIEHFEIRGFKMTP